MSDTNNLYIKLVRNEKRESREQPMFVAPPNIEAQKQGKNWTKGTKIGDTWYNQCAFEEFDEEVVDLLLSEEMDEEELPLLSLVPPDLSDFLESLPLSSFEPDFFL